MLLQKILLVTVRGTAQYAIGHKEGRYMDLNLAYSVRLKT